MHQLPNGDWRIEWDASPPKYIDWNKMPYKLTLVKVEKMSDSRDALWASFVYGMIFGLLIAAAAMAWVVT